MNIPVIKNCDIFDEATQFIVCPANSELKCDGGVGEKIFAAAGYNALSANCKEIGYCHTGSAVKTYSYDLKSRGFFDIIHAVVPKWKGGTRGEGILLYKAYRSALSLVYSCDSVTFPLLGAGGNGFPVKIAWEYALRACLDYMICHKEFNGIIQFAVRSAEKAEVGKEVLSELLERDYYSLDFFPRLFPFRNSVQFGYIRPHQPDGILNPDYCLEPVDWLVIHCDKHKTTLMTRESIASSMYFDHGNLEYFQNNPWSKSEVRSIADRWLESILGNDERKMLLPTETSSTQSKDKTKDYAFILSVQQVEEYLPTLADRDMNLPQGKDSYWWIMPEKLNNLLYPTVVLSNGGIGIHSRLFGQYADIHPCVNVSTEIFLNKYALFQKLIP